MAYFISLSFLIVLAISDSVRLNISGRNVICGLTLMSLVLIACLRHETGTDWDAYYRIYTDASESERVEVLYRIFNDGFFKSGIHYNIFLFFINVVSVFSISSAIKSGSKYYFTAFLIFFSDLYFYYNLSGQRQAVAMGLVLLALVYITQQKALRALILVTVAAGFHITAVVAYLGFLIPKHRYSARFLLLILFLISLVFLNAEKIFDLTLEYAIKDYSYYVYGQERSDSILSEFVVGAGRRLIPLAFIYYGSQSYFKQDNSTYLFNIYLVGLAIFLSFYMVSPDIGVRVSSYFLAAEYLIVGKLLQDSSKPLRLVIVSFYAVFSVYKVLSISTSTYFEYKTVFDGLI